LRVDSGSAWWKSIVQVQNYIAVPGCSDGDEEFSKYLFEAEPCFGVSFISLATSALQQHCCCVAALSATSMELKYFNARGAAEVIRLLFAMADEPFTDTRFAIEPGTMNAPAFTAAKASGDLVMNLGRAPVLVVSTDDSSGKDVVIGQSKAIERFLAKRFGFMGQNDVEAAQIDCIAEHCIDVRLSQTRKGFSMFNKDKTSEEKEKLRDEWFNTDLPGMLAKIEQSVEQTSQSTGFAVGSQTSFADIAIFALLKDCTMQVEQPLVEKAAEKCDLLMSIANRIAQHENIAKWIETRPVTNFRNCNFPLL
jgi:prostaglandin-H2 D-isomerase / glutathione transferase